MTISQMGKDSQGTADASMGSVHAGSTGISQSRVLAGWHSCEECFPGRSFRYWCVEKWPINYNKLLTINYHSFFGISKEGLIGILPQDEVWLNMSRVTFFVKQAGSAPFDVPAWVSLSALQKAEVLTHISPCLWSIFLSEYFPRSCSPDTCRAPWRLQFSSPSFLPCGHLL